MSVLRSPSSVLDPIRALRGFVASRGNGGKAGGQGPGCGTKREPHSHSGASTGAGAGGSCLVMNYGGGNLVEYVLSTNLHRRHLTAAQRSAITASVTDWATAQAHGGNRKADQVPILQLETLEKRAELSNTFE